MKSLADVLAPALAVAASALVACHDGSAEFHAAVKVRLGVAADATLDATFNATTSQVEIDTRVKCTFANGSEGSSTSGDG